MSFIPPRYWKSHGTSHYKTVYLYIMYELRVFDVQLLLYLTKGYWMRNNQNGDGELNGNLYNINKIQYLRTACRK